MTATLDHPSTGHPELIDFEVTNTCRCRYCEECSLGCREYECEECGADTEYLPECFGCSEEDVEEVAYFLVEWEKLNPSPTGAYVIYGENMGWRHRSGYKIIDSLSDAVDAIAVNSEWIQRWTVSVAKGSTPRAVQSHHDSTGEAYVIRPVLEHEMCVDCGEEDFTGTELHRYKDEPDEYMCEWCAEHYGFTREDIAA